jgi:uncharacterized Zn-binding protein involved in type VI secretion
MFDRLAADGDHTSTGGRVFAYSNYFNEERRPYARGENKATCGNCDGLWPISGSARDWMDDGLPMVKDGDMVMCPCRKNFVCASSNSTAFYSDSKGDSQATPPPKEVVFIQQYTITDREGRPVANTRYRVSIDSRIVASGVTDSSGKTAVITHDSARRLTLDIAH